MLAQPCACFGGLTLPMACVGLYGTKVYAVAHRNRRLASEWPWTRPAAVMWMILREVAVLSAFGLLVELVA
jgi:hypothetical protein